MVLAASLGTRGELIEAISVQGSGGMGEWTGIGRAGSIDIIAVVCQYQRVSTRGITVQNTPVNPTRFDSMANNGYDIDARPLLSK